MNRRLRRSMPPLVPIAFILLALATAISQQVPESPSSIPAPGADSTQGDADKVEADGHAAGDKGHSILDGLLPDNPLDEKPLEDKPPPPSQSRPVVPPPEPVVAAVVALQVRLGPPDDPAPPAEVRRVRYAIAVQIAEYQGQIANEIDVESNGAAVRLLAQVGRAAADREPTAPNRDPAEELAAPPRSNHEIRFGPSRTFQQLNDYVEPVSSAAGGPRPSDIAPLDREQRETARRIFGGGDSPAVPVGVVAAAPGESAEAERKGAAQAFGEDAGVGSLGGRKSDTEFFTSDKAASVYATSPYWRGPAEAPSGDGSVVDTRGMQEGAASTTSPSSVSPINAAPRILSDLNGAPPPTPIVFTASSAADVNGDDLGGVRIGFSAAALRAATIPARLTEEFERKLVAAHSEEELSAAMHEMSVEAAKRIVGRMRSRTIDELTTVSLKKLCDELEDCHRRGVELPERLRRPGSLRRIVGYIVVPEAGDLLLLGSRKGPGSPLDVDDLIVALQTTWRDGDEPACSLDPNPHDFGGPQVSRILGVPRDSHFAAVMLRADYEMKRVLFGQRPVDVPGFVDLKSRLSGILARDELGSEMQWLARFWFTPSPPRAGDVQTSPDGRIAIFDARMRLETEAMEVRGNSLGGTGRADPILQEMMRQFTASMASMQTEVPEFAELQTLFDVVMFSSVLKTSQVNHSLLSRLTALRHKPFDVPRSYPGLTTFIDYEGLTIMAIQGGVATRPALARASIAVRSDAALERLQRDGVKLAGELSSDRSESLMLLERESRDIEDTDSGMLAIRQLISAGHARRAVEAASERIRQHAADSDNYIVRSEAYAAAGLFYLAERDLRLAGIAGADPRRLFILRTKIGHDRGDLEMPRNLLSPGDLDRLADVYLNEVAGAAASGDLSKASERLDRVEKLAVKRPQVAAWQVRLLAARGRLEDARQTAATATEKHPDDSGLWLLRAGLAQTDDRERAAEALRWAGRASELDQQSVDALLMQAKLRVIVDPLESDAAAADVRKARAIAPNHPEAAVVQARLAVLQGDLDGALAACNRAIRASPGYVPAYLQRIYVRSLQGDSPPAFVADLRDCNTILIVKPQDWRTRMVRAEMFTKLDDDRLAELARDPKRMASITAPIIVEHVETLTILPKLKTVPPENDPEHALQLVGLLRMGLAEAAAADFEKAATTAPAEIAGRLREKAKQIRADIKPPP